VVTDDQPTLRQGLRLTFADDPRVEVVVDRRGAEAGPPVPGGETRLERRQLLSPDHRKKWRDLKFLLVDRSKGMTVYEAGNPQAPDR
jgi:hypothetical protein